MFIEPERPPQNKKKEVCMWNNYIYFDIILVYTFLQILTGISVQNQISYTTVHITIKVVNTNPAHGEMFSVQHYVIKLVSDLG